MDTDDDEILHASITTERVPTLAQLARKSVRIVLTGPDLVVTITPVAAPRNGYATLAYWIGSQIEARTASPTPSPTLPTIVPTTASRPATCATPRITYVTSHFQHASPSDVNADMWLQPLRAAFALYTNAVGVECIVTTPSGTSRAGRSIDTLRILHADEWSLLYNGDDMSEDDDECAHRYRKPTLHALLAWHMRAAVLPQLPELLHASQLLGKARAIAGIDDEEEGEPLTLDAVLAPCGHALSLSTFNRLTRGANVVASCPTCRASVPAGCVQTLWC